MLMLNARLMHKFLHLLTRLVLDQSGQRGSRPFIVLVPRCAFILLAKRAAFNKAMEAFPICLDDPVGWAQLHNFVQILQGLLHLIQSDFAAGSLVESLGRLLDVVGVCEVDPARHW